MTQDKIKPLDEKIKQLKEDIFQFENYRTASEVKEIINSIENVQKSSFKNFLEEVEDLGSYFNSVWTSNRFWVMYKENRMIEKKFEEILNMIEKDIKNKINKSALKHLGEGFIWK